MKSLFIKIIQLVAVITLITGQSQAQMPAASIISATKVENPNAVQNLMQFEGRWEAEATLIIDGKEYKMNYWVEGKSEAGGSALYADEGFLHPELGKMKGANLAGWDPYDQKIKWFSVDNMGTTHLHVGDWLTPNHLQLVYSGNQGSSNYVETIDFQFKGATNFTLHLIATLDGIETISADGSFEKMKDSETPGAKQGATPKKTTVNSPDKKPAPVKK